MRFLFGGCATAMEFFMNTLTETVDLQAPPPPLAFTDAAVAKVKDLLAEENSPGLNLRVFVQGGGCSGFQYGFTFDETVNDDDTTVDKDGVKLLIDPMSFQYLVRSEEHTSELQSLMRISYAVFCLKKQTKQPHTTHK